MRPMVSSSRQSSFKDLSAVDPFKQGNDIIMGLPSVSRLGKLPSTSNKSAMGGHVRNPSASSNRSARGKRIIIGQQKDERVQGAMSALNMPDPTAVVPGNNLMPGRHRGEVPRPGNESLLTVEKKPTRPDSANSRGSRQGSARKRKIIDCDSLELELNGK